MSWYTVIKASSDSSIVDLVYNEWKDTSFESNVGTIIHRIYQIGLPADSKKDKIEKRTIEVVKELAVEDGDMQLWHKVMEDRLYFSRIKNSVKKQYRKKVKEIEAAKNGPLPINTPQTPAGPPGGGMGGGMMM
jgi:hypothetical protein